MVTDEALSHLQAEYRLNARLSIEERLRWIIQDRWVGIEPARASCRCRVTALALSVARRVIAVGIPRADPYGRSLAHTVLISDGWRRSAHWGKGVRLAGRDVKARRPLFVLSARTLFANANSQFANELRGKWRKLKKHKGSVTFGCRRFILHEVSCRAVPVCRVSNQDVLASRAHLAHDFASCISRSSWSRPLLTRDSICLIVS